MRCGEAFVVTSAQHVSLDVCEKIVASERGIAFLCVHHFLASLCLAAFVFVPFPLIKG